MHWLRSLVVAGALLAGFSAHASFTFVDDCGNGNDSMTLTTLSCTHAPSSGNLVVAYVKWEGADTTVTVDYQNGTNAFTAGVATGDHANGDLHGQWFYLLSAGTGGTSIRANWAAGRVFTSIHVYEYSVTLGGNVLSFDTQGCGTGTGTAASSGNITTTGTDELVFGGYSEYIAIAATTPLVNGLAADGSIIFTGTAPANYTASWRRAFGSTFTGAATITAGGSSDWLVCAAAFKIAAGASPATLSSATPSGTLGTSTTATLGATTDVTSGNFYSVVESTGALLVAITAAQIKAGNNNTGSAADAACGPSAVSTTTPSCGVTGLVANTAYSYASIQNSAGGDSNIVTGTFTTATASNALLIRRRRP